MKPKDKRRQEKHWFYWGEFNFHLAKVTMFWERGNSSVKNKKQQHRQNNTVNFSETPNPLQKSYRLKLNKWKCKWFWPLPYFFCLSYFSSFHWYECGDEKSKPKETLLPSPSDGLALTLWQPHPAVSHNMVFTSVDLTKTSPIQKQQQKRHVREEWRKTRTLIFSFMSPTIFFANFCIF